MTSRDAAPARVQAIQVERWPTEIPLLVVVGIAAAGIWLMATVTIVMLVYAILLGVFFFVTHLLFVTHVRGNAVRIGPDQFPELHRRVVELAERAGLKRMPEAYVMQAGGALNALATKFLRTEMVVLFSDLLMACEEDDAARDMIIGHEIGHIRSGHLRFFWFLLPGFLVPFLGAAYSRARELTCDRWGAALCGDRAAAVRGLTILAAGGSHARQVNVGAFARQRDDLDTGWMTLGSWLSTYPPLSSRIVAIDPALSGEVRETRFGAPKALAIIGAALLLPMALSVFAFAKLAPTFRQAMREATEIPTVSESESPTFPEDQIPSARDVVAKDFDALAAMLNEYHAKHGKFPRNTDLLYSAWEEAPNAREAPLDPFDGRRYGYERTEAGYELYSSGPDGVADTEDDILREFNGANEVALR